MKNAKRNFESYTIWALSQSELQRLLAACSNQADRVMILLASRYGLRREDVIDIEINNIDLDNLTLTYRDNKKKKNRTIPIESDVAQEIKILKGAIPKKQIYLFPFRDGTTAWRHLQDLCAIAGIPIPQGRTGRPFHSLRGTCVKMRQKQGWTLNEVAALIGDEPETVAIHYATTTMGELADKMLGGR